MTFTYDGLGRAASRKAGSARTDLWYDQTGLTLESGSLAATYLRDPDGLLLSANAGGSTYNYGRDRLGSITALTNTGAQTLATTNRYDPWGTGLSGSDTLPNRLRFIGGYRDPDAFYILGQRHYRPNIARFTQLDPDPRSITDLNRYAYAGCNPTNYVDPTGTQFYVPPCRPDLAGVGIARILLGGLALGFLAYAVVQAGVVYIYRAYYQC
jgi:RHS repeat-associated protein